MLKLVLLWSFVIAGVQTGGVERSGPGGSICNDLEADIVATCTAELLCSGIAASSIGVICLYKSQVDQVLARLGTLEAALNACSVQVSTVDAFQVCIFLVSVLIMLLNGVVLLSL